MPRAWKLGALAALVLFAAIWAPLTWLSLRGGAGVRPTHPPPPVPQSIDGRWRVDPHGSSIRTPLVRVDRLSGEALISGRVLVRAHLTGGRATFDVDRPVSLRRVRRGRSERVVLSGKARLLFLSRRVTVPVDVLWTGDRLRISGRRGDNELRLELARTQ